MIHVPTRPVQGVQVPQFCYGTAWKEEATESLVTQALQAGFRFIDTANQRKHYFEAAVGQALHKALNTTELQRNELFLQSKYTFQAGQDHRLPYDPQAPIADQVQQSMASSLEHLGCEALDSYVLHGPSTRGPLQDADWEAWRAMEKLHEQGLTRLLGVSNVTAAQLRELLSQARVLPAFVQNRCFAITAWDHEVRQICQEQQIVYQGFSLLTANLRPLQHPEVIRLMQLYDCSLPQLVFAFALSVGMIPLTGTSSVQHMREDLAIFERDWQSWNELLRLETLFA